jgi:hypothetical protein
LEPEKSSAISTYNACSAVLIGVLHSEWLPGVGLEHEIRSHGTEESTSILEDDVADTELSGESASVFAEHEGKRDSGVEV